MKLLIFDLDGTLIDSRLDLAHAVNATRAHMGRAPIANDLVYSYVGNGAPVLMRRALPDASDSDLEQALAYFLDYYRDHMLDYTVLYPGVKEALDRMRDAGLQLAVLTNKPVRISQAIAAGLGIGAYFFRIYGGNSFEHKKPNPIGIEKLMAESGIGPDETLMIGDSKVDVQTARNAEVPVCGVTWGFQPETLEHHPPDLLIGRMEQLTDYVLNGHR
jgi:phosphoglycolate phosphatase